MSQYIHPKPAFSIIINGRNISAEVSSRLIELSLDDRRGMEADQFELTLDDTDGKLPLPARGEEIFLHIGWSDSGLVDKGSYIIDEVEHSGAPDVLRIRARSADLRGSLTKQQERSWDDIPLGTLIRTIAQEHGLQPVISESLEDEQIRHMDQTNESDANFLSRLAKQYDAVATVKKGMLLFLVGGGGQSASGKALPTITLTRKQGDQHRYTITDRDNYKGVKATYNDPGNAEKNEVTWGSKDKDDDDGSLMDEDSDTHVKTLRHVYSGQDEAINAAQSEWRRIRRGVASFSIRLAHGRADLFPEMGISPEGFKADIDAGDWLIESVKHTISEGGYTCQVECSIRGDAPKKKKSKRR